MSSSPFTSIFYIYTFKDF